MVDVIDALDRALPDERVAYDVAGLLRDQRNDRAIVDLEIGGTSVRVPLDARIDIVTKAFFKEYFDIGFGTGYRVQVALGGIEDCQHGVLHARYCFVTLYYNAHGDLLTADMHTEMR